MRLWAGSRENICDKAIRRAIAEGATLIVKGPKERSRILGTYDIVSSRVLTIQEVRGQALLMSTTPVVLVELDVILPYLLGITPDRLLVATWSNSNESPVD